MNAGQVAETPQERDDELERRRDDEQAAGPGVQQQSRAVRPAVRRRRWQTRQRLPAPAGGRRVWESLLSMRKKTNDNGLSYAPARWPYRRRPTASILEPRCP